MKTPLCISKQNAALILREPSHSGALLKCKALFGTAVIGTMTFQAAAQIESAPEIQRNHFGLSYRAGFNISADFHKLGGFSSPGSTARGVDHNYDNGYNRVDSSGNAGGVTWNWGYENASQLPGNGTVVMNRVFSAADTSSVDVGDDPQHGVELTYTRDIGETCLGGRWGFEGAFNYMNLDITDNRALIGNVTTVSDAFALNGVIPPLAPYNGLPSTPGPTISDLPVRSFSTTTGGAFISGERRIRADVFGLRLGPYWQIPVCKKASVQLGGGLVLADVDGSFSFRESVTLPGRGTELHSGSTSGNRFMYGGYLSLNLNVALNESWGAFAGFQYQNVGGYSHNAGGKEARVDLGTSLFMTLGFNYGF